MKITQTPKYCPKCKSYNIERKKRGFIRKIILRFSPLYECRSCKYYFTSEEFDKVREI